jgi:phosphoribosylglycinamide formyltransferase-1
MKKIVILVSGGGTNLQAIIDAIRDGKIRNAEIACVISSKDGVFALERAKSAGINTAVLPRRDYKNNEEYSAALAKMLLEINPDLIVYAGFMTILTEAVCTPFSGKMINVHPALIPSFSGEGFYGLRVHAAALERGVKVTGATVHFVTAECDGGPIIMQKAVNVLDGDTPETLQKRVMEEAEWIILPAAIDYLLNEGGK